MATGKTFPTMPQFLRILRVDPSFVSQSVWDTLRSRWAAGAMTNKKPFLFRSIEREKKRGPLKLLLCYCCLIKLTFLEIETLVTYICLYQPAGFSCKAGKSNIIWNQNTTFYENCALVSKNKIKCSSNRVKLLSPCCVERMLAFGNLEKQFLKKTWSWLEWWRRLYF